MHILHPCDPPDIITDHNSLITRIADSIRNAHITAHHGHAKTLFCRHLTDQLDDAYQLPCHQHTTTFTTIQELARQLTGDAPPTGIQTSRLTTQLADQLGQRPVFILDNIDHHDTPDDLLTTLLGINQPRIITTATQPDALDSLGPCTQSRLQPRTITIQQYTDDQIHSILTSRLPDTDAADHITEHVDNPGFGLVWLHRVLQTGNDLDDADTQRQAAKMFHDHLVRGQNQHLHYVLEAIYRRHSTGDQVESGDIYDAYQQVCDAAGTDPRTDRRVHDYLQQLERFGIIQTEMIGGGIHGRTKAIHLQHVPDDR